MPRKLRELVGDLLRADFIARAGRDSHRNFMHPTGSRITLSGRVGDDAKPYQERGVADAIKEARDENE